LDTSIARKSTCIATLPSSTSATTRARRSVITISARRTRGQGHRRQAPHLSTALQAKSGRSALSAKRSAFWNGARSSARNPCACATGNRASRLVGGENVGSRPIASKAPAATAATGMRVRRRTRRCWRNRSSGRYGCNGRAPMSTAAPRVRRRSSTSAPPVDGGVVTAWESEFLIPQQTCRSSPRHWRGCRPTITSRPATFSRTRRSLQIRQRQDGLPPARNHAVPPLLDHGNARGSQTRAEGVHRQRAHRAVASRRGSPAAGSSSGVKTAGASTRQRACARCF